MIERRPGPCQPHAGTLPRRSDILPYAVRPSRRPKVSSSIFEGATIATARAFWFARGGTRAGAAGGVAFWRKGDTLV